MLAKFEELENKTIVVKQVKSEACSNERQKETLKGLGLRGIGSVAELKCTNSIYGMLVKMIHLLEVNIKR